VFDAFYLFERDRRFIKTRSRKMTAIKNNGGLGWVTTLVAVTVTILVRGQ
jgi:hypothetical protein